MGLGKVKRFGAGLVAAATLAGGAALAAPAVAMAAPPKVSVEQDGNDVTVTTTDENSGSSFCVPLLVSGTTALSVLADYNAGEYSSVLSTLLSGDGVNMGKAASDDVANPLSPDAGVFFALPNPSATTFTVDNGVYILVGTCFTPSIQDVGTIVSALLDRDLSALAGLATDDITVKPLIVPNGIGSISPALSFGSLLLKSGDALSALSSDGMLSGLLGGGS